MRRCAMRQSLFVLVGIGRSSVISMVPTNGGGLTPCIFHHPYARCCRMPASLIRQTIAGLPLGAAWRIRFPRLARVPQLAPALAGRRLLSAYDVTKLEVGETARVVVMREQTLDAVVTPQQ